MTDNHEEKFIELWCEYFIAIMSLDLQGGHTSSKSAEILNLFHDEYLAIKNHIMRELTQLTKNKFEVNK